MVKHMVDDFGLGGDFDAAFAMAIADASGAASSQRQVWWHAAVALAGSLALVATVSLAVLFSGVPTDDPTAMGPGDDGVEALSAAPIHSPIVPAVVVEADKEAEEEDVSATAELPFKDWEPAAMLGRLDLQQIEELEGFRDDESQTVEDRVLVSHVLMTNALGKGDRAAWEDHVVIHMDSLPPTADLHYRYALHLSKFEDSDDAALGVFEHADAALELRKEWTGATYTQRMYDSFKLRAVVAKRMWERAEVTGDERLIDHRRQQAFIYFREWHDFAVAAGKDAGDARMLCQLAAGRADVCVAP